MSASGLAGRGDLIRALAADRPDLLTATARLLGYTYVPRRRQRRKREPELPPLPPPPPIAEAIERKPLADVPYWVPTDFHAEAEPAEPESQTVRPADKVVWSGRPPPPAHEALAPWNELATRLRLALAEPADTDRLDVDGIVARIGRGELIERLPRQRRRLWGRRLLIIDDRSRRLAPFWPDQDEVAGRIRALFPRGAVERARSWGPFSPPMVISKRDRRRDLPLEPGTRVLLLGDLGCLSDDPGPLRAYWEEIGRRLTAAGCRTVTLNPSPGERWFAAPAGYWRQVVWERSVARRPIDGEARAERVRRLLRLVAPAVQVEAGLLRSARRLLPPDEADAGTEADAWNDAAVASQAGLTAVLQETDLRALRQEFADDAKVSPDRRQQLLQRLRAWRAETPQGVWFEELRSLDERSWQLFPAADAAEAARFFVRIADCAGTGRRGADARAWFRRLERRLPDHAWVDPEIRPALNRLWAAADQADDIGTPPPADFRASDVTSNDQPSRIYLSQRGDTLHAAIEPSAVALVGSPLALLQSRNRLVTLDEAIVDDGFWRSGAPPSWAREWGTDAYGPWVTFAIDTADGGSVVQRLRWIAAGTFLMGSPTDEPERWDDEGPQHAVTISCGFWLADTACTQALWQAVMGENPSAFKGDERPVEQVSWDDVQAFLDRLDERLPGLGLRLPSEAEWEYSCRAGTTTPFSFGANITSEQANYDGNQPYPGGGTGPFRGEALPVASLPANPWGLYEMHGNVWEWCADGQRRYGSKSVTDPLGPTEAGALRVLRGGSWNDSARLVRSAYRLTDGSGYRSGSFGFRCARVQKGAEPRGAENGWAAAGRQAERRTATDRPGAAAALLRLDGERPQAASPLPAVPTIIVRSDCESLTLRRITCPVWASGIGRDRFGLWAEFELVPAARSEDTRAKIGVAQPGKPVIQRLRWIPPGRFRMGSPKEEPGRWEAEGPQHLVTIGNGFWLADTPCTQALWQAVMGDNPSEFKSAERPVEQVSWDDVQAYLASINKRIPGLDLVLPTEAQWEYACRAGTATATYAGDLTILGERNGPALDAIAWYGGNSGEGFDLPNGYDSSDWPEKQYSHTRAGTRPVRLKAPNDWGLYDMLGNVWEWCADTWYAGYEGAPADGSIWQDAAKAGAGRVLRGSSWLNYARSVRSASRYAHVPGNRYGLIGFRCARIQP